MVSAFDRYRALYAPNDIGTWNAYQGFIDGGMAASLFNPDNAHLTQAPPGTVDYADLSDSETLAPLAAIGPRPARLLVAARIGGTRLIDNMPVSGNLSASL